MKESISIVIIKIKIVNTNNFILDPKRLTILAVYKLLFNPMRASPLLRIPRCVIIIVVVDGFDLTGLGNSHSGLY